MFWIKLGLFVIDGAIALLIVDRKIKNIEAKSKGQSIDVGVVSIWGLVSVVIILTITILGVFIANAE